MSAFNIRRHYVNGEGGWN